MTDAHLVGNVRSRIERHLRVQNEIATAVADQMKVKLLGAIRAA